jgi:hypothetical protein
MPAYQTRTSSLGGRTSASAECRHWSGRAVRWSSWAIRRCAAAATDVVLEGHNRALQALQAPLWTNGAGVLADPSMVRSNLHRAKAAIDMALDAMNNLDGWPQERDYE